MSLVIHMVRLVLVYHSGGQVRLCQGTLWLPLWSDEAEVPSVVIGDGCCSRVVF